jgi:hypothetical protein
MPWGILTNNQATFDKSAKPECFFGFRPATAKAFLPVAETWVALRRALASFLVVDALKNEPITGTSIVSAALDINKL